MPFLLELDRQIVAGSMATRVFIGGRAVQSSGMLEGAERVQLIAGDGKHTLELIKAQLPAMT
ncbi:hypothetical protein D3C84_1237690 [compost metagenome]